MGGVYWLASYFKSGNTWLRLWIRNLRSPSDAPVDINAIDTPIASSRQWLDDTLGFDTADLDFEETDRLRPAVYDWHPGNRAITYHKAHDAYRLLADGSPMFGTAVTLGAVYVIRNPLDVAISYAAHNGRTIDQAVAFMGNMAHAHNDHPDRIALQVRQKLLNWSGHVESWVDADRLTVHLLRYEDMHANPEAMLASVARFLGLPDDPARVAKAVRDSSFERLRAEEQRNGFAERPPGMAAFFREGRTGGWRNTLSDAQVERIIADHGPVMRRFGYLDARGNPL